MKSSGTAFKYGTARFSGMIAFVDMDAQEEQEKKKAEERCGRLVRLRFVVRR